ncbi:hypothetical protein BX264_6539 [Streptomyces sp. 2333.5]|uniref:hypothetical protein n=1 Tax=Streptomyces TaxID=1883 RepID=UPI000899B152|nr:MULTISPECIES: hypothetical protein [unclassified Streptomyces]PJJ06051.1 hypothetical protein BX264_6539 [Streptomyces sp. 2333.5]SEE89310.1 hypothetical protein SAMN05428943_6638 [Streptomyces sp. 2314.4]SEF06363.1 hypothetical protein SAMN05428942_6636 [Streptomyces sp. 2112.2]
MDIAALISWVITALGGFYMLGTWLSRGGAKAGSPGGYATRTVIASAPSGTNGGFADCSTVSAVFHASERG